MARRWTGALALSMALALSVPVLGQEAGDAGGAASDSIGDLQQRMRADPQIVGDIETLRSDPGVQAVLNDPEIMDALNRGDIAAVLANPKIAELAENPAVQDITRALEEK